MDTIFKTVFAVIESRKQASGTTSYVASLFEAGQEKILDKIREESRELCDAAHESDVSAVIHEFCDLFFHAQILLAEKNITWEQIEAEMARRFGTSGHDEKKSRGLK